MTSTNYVFSRWFLAKVGIDITGSYFAVNVVKALIPAVANPGSVSSPACQTHIFPPSWDYPALESCLKKSLLQQGLTPTSPCWEKVKYNKFHIWFWRVTSFKRKEWWFKKKIFLLRIFSLPSACHEDTVQERMQEEGNTPNGFYLEVEGTHQPPCLWLWTRPREPSTSKSSIRIHKSSPALSLCLSLTDLKAFKSAPRFLLVQGSGLWESGEEKLYMGSAPTLPGRGLSLTFASPVPNARFSCCLTYSASSATQEGFNKRNLEQPPTGWACVRIWVSRKAWLQKCYLRLSTKIQRPCKKEKESAGSSWELSVHPWNKKFCQSTARVRSWQARCHVWVVCVWPVLCGSEQFPGGDKSCHHLWAPAALCRFGCGVPGAINAHWWQLQLRNCEALGWLCHTSTPSFHHYPPSILHPDLWSTAGSQAGSPGWGPVSAGCFSLCLPLPSWLRAFQNNKCR